MSEQLGTLVHLWDRGLPLSTLGEMFAFFAGGEGRLSAANGTQSLDFTDVPHPTLLLQILYWDSQLEKRIGDVSVRAFDEPLVLNRFAGNRLCLHVGEAPPSPPVGEPPSPGHAQTQNSLPPLDDQGDGIKGFLGLLLCILVTPYLLVFVDEPKAFLHPPQARLLGRMLGEDKGAHNQVFIATHDRHVLTGLLESSAEITIVRLVRDGDGNRTSQLNYGKVKELWNDPQVRYSNVLDGLFHQAVVLCEADADCRYYNSVLDSVEAAETESRRPQLLLMHCAENTHADSGRGS